MTDVSTTWAEVSPDKTVFFRTTQRLMKANIIFVTVDRDTKSKGDIVGFSLNKGAVHRWLLTSHERAAIIQAYREMAGLSDIDGDGVIKETGESRMAVDDNDVQKVQATLANWGNPFSSSETDEICHLASGKTAPKNIECDLLTAYDRGNEAMEIFVQRRLVKAEVPFYDRIPKMRLSTFASLSLSTVKICGKEVVLKADRDLFARLIVTAQTREIDLR